jgi:hypothetical protein
MSKMQNNILTALVGALAFSTSLAVPTQRSDGPKDNTELLTKLITAPTQIHRFQDVLLDASGSKLLDNEALAKATIYDFEKDKFNVSGTQGGWTNPVRLTITTFHSSLT